jgi:hypothetical protein
MLSCTVLNKCQIKTAYNPVPSNFNDIWWTCTPSGNENVKFLPSMTGSFFVAETENSKTNYIFWHDPAC